MQRTNSAFVHTKVCFNWTHWTKHVYSNDFLLLYKLFQLLLGPEVFNLLSFGKFPGFRKTSYKLSYLLCSAASSLFYFIPSTYVLVFINCFGRGWLQGKWPRTISTIKSRSRMTYLGPSLNDMHHFTSFGVSMKISSWQKAFLIES